MTLADRFDAARAAVGDHPESMFLALEFQARPYSRPWWSMVLMIELLHMNRMNVLDWVNARDRRVRSVLNLLEACARVCRERGL
jgi:hypothetical protein